MVEFGLKLKDNKVGEWSAHYIQYEKLKAIVEKAAASAARYNAIKERQPELVEAAKRAFELGQDTPKSSTTSLTNILEVHSQNEGGDDTEQTALLKRGKKDEETEQPLNKGYGSSNALLSAMEAATTGVTDYFNKSKATDRQIRSILKDLEKRDEEFGEMLVSDIDTVNAFYDKKLKELNGRLELLKESVTKIRSSATKLPPTPEDKKSPTHRDSDSDASEVIPDNLETPLLHKRKGIAKIFSRHPGRGRLGSFSLSILDRDETPISNEKQKKEVKEVESIQRAMVDMYRQAKLLQNYVIMNFTGFVKIVKKYDKTFKNKKGTHKKAIASEKICNDGKVVEKVISRMERLYATWFCDNNLIEARTHMLPKKGDSLEQDWSQLRLGYRLGMCTTLGFWLAYDCIWNMSTKEVSTIASRNAFPVIRCIMGLLVMQWCWAISVWFWSRYRVNYIYLFDFNPRLVRGPLTLFNEAVDNTLYWIATVLLYYKEGTNDIPGNFSPGILPVLLFFYTVYQLIVPFGTRWPMWKSILLVVTAPMKSPSFFHGYVGDLFTSMVKVFQDLAWTICFIVSGDWLIHEDITVEARHKFASEYWYKHVLIPLICFVPLWFRFNQCCRRYVDTGDRFPHLANALKYAMSQTVTLLSAFHPNYMLRANSNVGEFNLFDFFQVFMIVISTIYSFVWDVYMDWGLGRPEFKFLGPVLMYPSQTMYYTIIFVDFFLRCSWVLTLVPQGLGSKYALPEYLTTMQMVLELFRRTIWGFLRLENEHQHNAFANRRVDFVPLHFSTLSKESSQKEKQHRGVYVLLEVGIITAVVVIACVVAALAARNATEQQKSIIHTPEL